MIDLDPLIFFQSKHIGDVIMALPALGLLKSHYPEAKTALVLTPKTAALARQHPWVDDVYLIDRGGGLFKQFKCCRDIKKGSYKSAFIFDGQSRSIIMSALAGIKERVGDSRLYPLGAYSYLYTHDLGEKEVNSFKYDNQSLRCQKILSKAMGLKVDPFLMPLAPPLTDREREKAESLISELEGSGPLIALSLQGLQYEKSWPLNSFAALCRKLKTRLDARLFVTGAKEEFALAAGLASLAEVPVSNFCGRSSLMELLALAHLADLFITVDTGTAHVASLAQKPLISIFNWTNPAQWAPQNDKAEILCYNWALKRFGLDAQSGWHAADIITPEMVFEAALRALNRFFI